MTPAYRYHRFSSKAQDKGTSLERQGELTLALCEKNGWTPIEVLEDKGRSAWKGDHLRVGELGKFRQRVDAGEIRPGSVLVIENLDRLSRQDVKLARRWLEDVTEAGIKVAVCQPEIVLDEEAMSGNNIVSMLQYLLEAKRSNAESDRKSKLQNDAWSRFLNSARNGIAYSARAPSWLKMVKGQPPEVIEERAEIVRQIYEWSASGMGYESIAKKLNETVAPWTKQQKRDEAFWKVGFVRDILRNPAVEGEYHVKAGPDRAPTGERILGYYPRIVPADLVERSRAAQLARRGTGGPTHSEARNLFTGLAYCGHCGDAMLRTLQRTRGKEYEYLRCIRYQNGAGCENTTLYRYDVFERALLGKVLTLALDNTHFVQIDQTAPLAGAVADLKKQIEQVEAEQRRLLRFIMASDEAPEAEQMLNEVRPRLAALRVQLEEAEQAYDRAKGNVSPAEHLARVQHLSNAIRSEDTEVRDQARRTVRAAMQNLVTRIECSVDWVSQLKAVKSIKVAIAEGLMTFKFDGEGKLVSAQDFRNSPDHIHGLTAGAVAHNAPLVGEVLKRSGI